MTNALAELKMLVDALPEVYQPIFGYPEYSGEASRETNDRLEDIVSAYDALAEKLGRPLRVLDLGCAQGYISFTLAARGAQVLGVDFLPENIELCKKLSSLNPELSVDFTLSSVQEFVGSLENGHYDLVLLLSVIHHVFFHDSPEVAEKSVAKILIKSPVLLAELAVREEPLYWAESLPEHPENIFGEAKFVRKLRETGTHLSSVKRPLYFASRNLWYAAGRVGSIESVRFGGHRFARSSFKSSRAYFLSKDVLLKRLALSGTDASVNRDELFRERDFLREFGGSAEFPRLIAMDRDGDEFAYLLREKIEGQLVTDLLDAGEEVDYYLVIRDVLDQCISLEQRGLYHRDVRPWNVLRRDDGRFVLIDYGAISKEKSDCFWPQDIYISFLIFVRELVGAPDILTGPLRVLGVSPFGFPGHLSHWVGRLSAIPLGDWSFAVLRDELSASFLDPAAAIASVHPESAHDALIKMIEEAIAVLARQYGELDTRLFEDGNELRARLSLEASRISNVHHDLVGLSQEHDRLANSVEAHETSLAVVGSGVAHLEQRLTTISNEIERLGSTIEVLQHNVAGYWGKQERQLSGITGLVDSLHAKAAELEQSGVQALIKRISEAQLELGELRRDVSSLTVASAERSEGVSKGVSELVAWVRKGLWGRLWS